jgi:hypothetical protein
MDVPECPQYGDLYRGDEAGVANDNFCYCKNGVANKVVTEPEVKVRCICAQSIHHYLKSMLYLTLSRQP